MSGKGQPTPENVQPQVNGPRQHDTFGSKKNPACQGSLVQRSEAVFPPPERGLAPEDRGWFAELDRGRQTELEKKDKKAATTQNGINTLVEIVPEGVHALEETHGWEEIEMVVDSGATETVVSEEMIKSIETQPGEAMKRGVRYEVASGDLIPNLGEKSFTAVGEEGQERAIKAQVCEVNKALLSVHRMVQAGNTVVFSR